MSLSTFKKMIVASSFVVMAISATAQDREEGHSLAPAGVRVHASEARTGEDGSHSGLAGVVFDQLVAQPIQGLLGATAAFCRFSYEHPATALAMTATVALPVVAALFPDQGTTLWYPQFTCARKEDIQTLTSVVNGVTAVINYAPADRGYVFTPYTGATGFESASACSYANWALWGYKIPAANTYNNDNCTTSGGGVQYQWAQPDYTWHTSDVGGPVSAITARCAPVDTAP